MDEITLYKLNFNSPLHIGAHGVGYEETDNVIHSDTLFSAIMSLWGNFYNDDIESLCKTPSFIISSAFPFKKDMLFFPRPMVRVGKDAENNDQKEKKLKRVEFISQRLLESILKGESNNLEFNKKDTFQDGKFWHSNQSSFDKNNDIIFAERELPRVTIDRNTSSSEIFYFSEIVFKKDAGLFFLARFTDKQIKQKLEAVLRLLGDEGIGGDKRMGKGLFSLDIKEDFHILFPENADAFLILSLYYPKESEFNGGILKNASYNLISRKGWLHAHSAMTLRRKEIRTFTEGSIFNATGKQLYGKNPCVLEKNEKIGLKYNIYRYGIAFNLPMLREKQQ